MPDKPESLFDLSNLYSLQGTGFQGSDLRDPMELAKKVGANFVTMWAAYQLGLDSMVYDAVQGVVGNEQVSAPLSSVLLGGASDIAGGELRRIVGY